MKRVSVIIIHENYKTIETMTIRYNNSAQLVDLIRENEKPYKYEYFNDLYKSVLNILKNNNMYAKCWSGFNAKWYDIQWINTKNPTKIENLGYKEN